MQNNHLPTKDQLWKKYPELSRLWSEYKRLCNQPATMEEVSRAFNDYQRAYCTARDRYQIIQTEPEPAGVA